MPKVNTNTSQGKKVGVSPTEMLSADAQKPDQTQKPEFELNSLKPEKKPVKPFSTVILVGFLNVIAVALLVFILLDLPKKGSEVKKLRAEKYNLSQKDRFEIANREIKQNFDIANSLEKRFPDDKGLINFVNEIDRLKNDGTIKNFSFANQASVRDKTTYFGIPFIVEFEGSWVDVDRDLLILQKMPFFQRSVTINAKVLPDGLVNFKYGGFIYVTESLIKN